MPQDLLPDLTRPMQSTSTPVAPNVSGPQDLLPDLPMGRKTLLPASPAPAPAGVDLLPDLPSGPAPTGQVNPSQPALNLQKPGEPVEYLKRAVADPAYAADKRGTLQRYQEQAQGTTPKVGDLEGTSAETQGPLDYATEYLSSARKGLAEPIQTALRSAEILTPVGALGAELAGYNLGDEGKKAADLIEHQQQREYGGDPTSFGNVVSRAAGATAAYLPAAAAGVPTKVAAAALGAYGGLASYTGAVRAGAPEGSTGAIGSGLVGAAAGSLPVPISRAIASRITPLVGRGIAKQYGVNIGANYVEQAALGTGAVIGENAIAGATYNPERPLTAGARDALIGAIPGAIGFGGIATQQHRVAERVASASKQAGVPVDVVSPSKIIDPETGRRITKESRAVLKYVAEAATGRKAFGFEPLAAEDTAPGAFNDEENTYLNTKQPEKAIVSLVVHEALGHIGGGPKRFAQDVPNEMLLSEIDNLVAKRPGDVGASSQVYKASLAASAGENPAARSRLRKLESDAAFLQEEGVAQLFEEAIYQNPDAIKQLYELTPSVFKAIKQTAVEMIDSLPGIGTGQKKLKRRAADMMKVFDVLNPYLDQASQALKRRAEGYRAADLPDASLATEQGLGYNLAANKRPKAPEAPAVHPFEDEIRRVEERARKEGADSPLTRAIISRQFATPGVVAEKFFPQLNKWLSENYAASDDLATMADHARKDIASILSPEESERYRGYYSTGRQRERAMMGNAFPEMLKESDKWDVYNVFFALASPGTPLVANVPESINAYKHYREKGKIDIPVDEAGRYSTLPFKIGGRNPGGKVRQYRAFQSIVDSVGEREAIRFMKDSHSLADINALRERLGFGKIDAKSTYEVVEGATGQRDQIPGSFLFGPKIGAYMQNAFGRSEYLTGDTWEGMFHRIYRQGGLEIKEGKPITNPQTPEEFKQLNEFSAILQEAMGDNDVSAAQAQRWYAIKKALSLLGYDAGLSSMETSDEITKRYFEQAAGDAAPAADAGGSAGARGQRAPKRKAGGGAGSDVAGTRETPAGLRRSEALVNVGLNVEDGTTITREDAERALAKRGVRILSSNVQTSDTEPTLVAKLSRPLSDVEANETATELRQQAIAQYTGEGKGALHGPKASEWGDFNPEFFLREGGARESEEAKSRITPDINMEALQSDPVAVRVLAKNKKPKDGQNVGVRLNLNVLKNTGQMIQTVHSRSHTGEALDYAPAVTVRDAKFSVNQEARRQIAAGERPKFPMASVDGKYVDTIEHSKVGTEIRFNPKEHEHFVDMEGRPVESAEEATVYKNRVYARGVKYMDAEAAKPAGLKRATALAGEVLVDPTAREVRKFMDETEHGRVRGVWDRATGKTYFWDASKGTHAAIGDALELGFPDRLSYGINPYTNGFMETASRGHEGAPQNIMDLHRMTEDYRRPVDQARGEAAPGGNVRPGEPLQYKDEMSKDQRANMHRAFADLSDRHASIDRQLQVMETRNKLAPVTADLIRFALAGSSSPAEFNALIEGPGGTKPNAPYHVFLRNRWGVEEQAKSALNVRNPKVGMANIHLTDNYVTKTPDQLSSMNMSNVKESGHPKAGGNDVHLFFHEYGHGLMELAENNQGREIFPGFTGRKFMDVVRKNYFEMTQTKGSFDPYDNSYPVSPTSPARRFMREAAVDADEQSHIRHWTRQEYEWFAQTFANYVIGKKLPQGKSGSALKRIFDGIAVHLSDLIGKVKNAFGIMDANAPKTVKDIEAALEAAYQGPGDSVSNLPGKKVREDINQMGKKFVDSDFNEPLSPGAVMRGEIPDEYMRVGHGSYEGGGDNAELWVFHEGKLKNKQAQMDEDGSFANTHYVAFGPEVLGTAQEGNKVPQGRIDHERQVISFASLPEYMKTPTYVVKARQAVKQLQKQYPDYKIAVYGDADDGSSHREVTWTGYGLRRSGPPTVGSRFNIPGETPLDLLRKKVQDEFLPYRRVQEQVQQQGGTVNESSDANLKQTLFKGRVGEKYRKIDEHVVEPIVKIMTKSGLKVEDVDEYLYALHAGERNTQIAKINKTLPDGGSGMSNKDAADLITKWQADPRYKDIQEIARIVHRLNRSTLKQLVSLGLIDRRIAKSMQKAYLNYVPLRSDDGEANASGQGYTARSSGVKRATGRTDVADSPLMFSILQSREKIVRAEKNRVARAAARFVRSNPDKDLWAIDQVPMKNFINTKTGMVEQRIDPRFKFADNVVPFMQHGKMHMIEFKGDSGMRMANALKRANYEDGGAITALLGKAMRGYASLQTNLNPAFIGPNVLRDTATAFLRIAGDEGLAKAAAVTNPVHIAKAMKAVWDVQGDPNHSKGSEYHDAFREYREHGGKVDSYQIGDFMSTGKELEKLLKDADPNKSYLRKGTVAAGKVKEFIDRINGAAETATRLSAYREARRNGMSPERAAYYAKELTVNFNRKGEWGTPINLLYLFSNASTQGNVNVLRTLLRGKHGKEIGGTLLGLGLAAGLTGKALFGKDDEDRDVYANIPDNIKATNFVFPTGKGTYGKIPLPYGFNTVYSAGRLAGEVVTGTQKPGEAAMNSITNAADAFSPLGNEGSLLQTLSPTLLDPFVQQSENKSWTGRPIVPTKYRSSQPDSQLATRNTSNFSKTVATWLNSLSGGDEVTPGAVDISPALLDHWIGWSAGGLGREVAKTASLGNEAYRGTLTPNKLPLAHRFVGSQNEESLNRRDIGKINRDASDARTRGSHYLATGQTDKFDELSKESARDRAYGEWSRDIAKSMQGQDKPDADQQKEIDRMVSAYNSGAEAPRQYKDAARLSEIENRRRLVAKLKKDSVTARSLERRSEARKQLRDLRSFEVQDAKEYARLRVLEKRGQTRKQPPRPASGFPDDDGQ